MKPRDPKARSLEALQAAVGRHGEERDRSAARGPEPWPGDLYRLAEASDFPVEWLVVERAASGSCRVVAADTNPALGNADVPVPAGLEGGPLSVRCAVSLQIGVETLRRGERTGIVDTEILDPVRRRLEELAAGSLDAAPDPELEDWHAEVLAPARAALLPPGVQAPGPPPRRFSRRAAVAATLLLLAALGGLSAAAWRFHRGELQARSEIDRLVHERWSLEAEHQRQLAALRDAQARAQRPPAPPPPAPVSLQPLVNLAYATFYPGETRGTEQEIAIPGEATHLFLLVYVGDREPCKEYELEITRRGAPAPALTARGLRPLSGQEVSVAIPRTQLPDGSYQLRLYGVCKGERRELGTYEARLKEGAR
ncbi:MAG TPA: hypothetical protein VH988_07695 [Thermoanaerobaculia bacterium]|jgi:hypothetical protein|nr:hypothetical protein [Thermoanaerobaculia bacterium]